ncbi:hypothetical protein [Ensifer sp.]|uniref:hypothetical protein n=1 Tax=Ensifer sp. TaxID=1872086 RepID=UPI002E10CBD8|nr:hypothetical protein [Ensifer sp.]
MLRYMTPGSGAIQSGQLDADTTWMRHLDERDYLVEPWHCDLASGVFHLGQQTASLLGLPARSCGIVDFTRAYDRKDRTTILNILEQATASPSSFCFTAMARASTLNAAQLFCIGRSVLDAPSGEERLQGIFAVRRERVVLCA